MEVINRWQKYDKKFLEIFYLDSRFHGNDRLIGNLDAYRRGIIYLNNMFRKGNKLYSIFTGACPKCHEESMFKNKNPYILSEALDMNETCSHCGTKYKIEPSFFYGAMYVSYAVGIAFAVAAFVISSLVFQASVNIVFISIVLTLIVFMPIILRLSRNIWINFFIHYDESLVKK